MIDAFILVLVLILFDTAEEKVALVGVHSEYGKHEPDNKDYHDYIKNVATCI